jgi:hypothetical protein
LGSLTRQSGQRCLHGYNTLRSCNARLEEEDDPLVFHHACKLGLEGIVSKREDSLSLGALAGLAQIEEPGLRSRDARGGRGLGKKRWQ